MFGLLITFVVFLYPFQGQPHCKGEFDFAPMKVLHLRSKKIKNKRSKNSPNLLNLMDLGAFILQIWQVG